MNRGCRRNTPGPPREQGQLAPAPRAQVSAGVDRGERTDDTEDQKPITESAIDGLRSLSGHHIVLSCLGHGMGIRNATEEAVEP